MIQVYAKIWYALFQRAKTILLDSNLWGKYYFDIEVIGQGHIDVMNVRDKSYHGDSVTCQT